MPIRKILGILAGMGPRSTAPFLELVYDECQSQYGATYDIDYPEIVIYSWPTPFYVDREIDDAKLYNSIKDGLVELEKNNVSVIAMPCNIAHKYFDRLKGISKSNLLNIIEITKEKLSEESKRITVFATKATMELGIYQNGIQKKGREFVFRAEWQDKVTELIRCIKRKDNSEVVQIQYKALADEVSDAGIDTIIHGCTDLSMIKRDEDSKYKVIDSSKELAKRLIEEYLEEKRR